MKTAIKHILVPTDFSGFSNHAFQFACNMAVQSEAKITLFHVVEPPYNFAVAVEGMLELMEKNAYKRMKMIAASCEAEIDIKTEVRHGRTSREILNFVETSEADIVVMGSRGQSGLSRAVLGSVSAAIAHELPVPLFVIPEETTNAEVSSLLFATNFRENDPSNFLLTSSLADLIDASVSVIHVSQAMDFETRIRHLGFTEVLRKETGNKSLKIELIENENLLLGLANYITEKPISGIVLNRYKKSVVQKLFGKDHTDEMLTYADLPLLILP